MIYSVFNFLTGKKKKKERPICTGEDFWTPLKIFFKASVCEKKSLERTKTNNVEAADQLEESEGGMFCNIKKQDRFAEYEVNKLLSESSALENASRLNVCLQRSEEENKTVGIGE